MRFLPWLHDPAPWRLSARRWPAWLLLALFLGNAVIAAILNSGTCDELGAHIPAGWLYWKSGVFSGGLGNFPLGQLLITAPAALLGGPYALWTEQHLFLFRLPGILLGAALCLLVWRFATRRFGPGAGLAALFFAALCPNLLAHSTVATLDLPLAFFIFLGVFVLDRYVERPGPWRLAFLAVVLATASLVKVQALLLYPYALFVLGITAWRTRRLRDIAWWLLFPAAWLLLVSIVYRHMPGRGGALLPPLYLEAAAAIFQHAEQGHFGYLLGKYSTSGWWYYFPVAILVKTPIAELVLAGFGLARKQSRQEILFVTVPILLFLVPAMFGSIDIGLRHILMIYPFLAVAAGSGVVRLWDVSRDARAAAAKSDTIRGLPWRRLAVAVLLLSVAVEAAVIAPHHLSYFNLFAGGAANGHRVLIDSNYDWGQNDRTLRRYLDRTGPPARIDPYAFRPANGRILVNANALYGVLNGGDRAYEWLRRFRPVHRVAFTWFEYEIPPGTFDEPREDEEARRQVLAHLFRLREAARLVPGPEFRTLLAQGFASLGAYDVTFDELRLCLEKHPGYAPALIFGGEQIVRWKLGVLVFHGREYLDGFRTPPPVVPDNEDQLVALAQRGGMAAGLAGFETQLGQILESVRDPRSARDAYRLAARLQPSSPDARAGLQRLGGVP